MQKRKTEYLTINLFISGSSYTRKSTLNGQYVKHEILTKFPIGTNYNCCSIDVNGMKVKLQIFDVSESGHHQLDTPYLKIIKIALSKSSISELGNNIQISNLKGYMCI